MIRDEGEAVVMVWTTLPGSSAPSSFARALVTEGLAACVTAQEGLTSVFRWQGAVEEAVEHQLTIKTTAARVDALERRIAELHPYDVPEFLVSPVLSGSAAYLDWVRTSTQGQI